MRLDTELFQAVIEVQQAVAAAGLDSGTVMHVIAERSRALTGASGVVVETLEGEEAGAATPDRGREPAAQAERQPVGRHGPDRRAAAIGRHPDGREDRARRLSRPGYPLDAGGAAPRRQPHHRRAQGAFADAKGVQRPRCQGAAAARRAGRRVAGARGGIRVAPGAAGGADPGAAGERAALQAAGRRGPGRHLGGGRPRHHHLRQPADGGAAGLPERRHARPAGVRLLRRDSPGDRAADAGPPAAGDGEPRLPVPQAGRDRGVGPRLRQPDLGPERRRRGHGRHGHRHHRAEAAPRIGSAARPSAWRCSTTWTRRSWPRARPPRSAVRRWAACGGWCRATAAPSSCSTSRAARRSSLPASAPARRCPRARWRWTGSRRARCCAAGPSARSRTWPRSRRRRRCSRRCARRACGACSACRSWRTPRPSARSTSRRIRPTASTPSTATSRWRSPRRSPSPSSRPGSARSCPVRRGSWSAGSPSAGRRFARPPPSWRRCCTPCRTTCVIPCATCAGSASSCSTTRAARSTRPSSTMPGRSATAPRACRRWWTTWCTSSGWGGRT